MRLRWIIPIAFLLPLHVAASEPVVAARTATVLITPGEVTLLHLRPEFDSVIRMPEEVTSVFLGSPSLFKAEHSEGEPLYVIVKPITTKPAQSDLHITTKSGEHVLLELISEGVDAASKNQPVDFLLEYRASRSFLISPAAEVHLRRPDAASLTQHPTSGPSDDQINAGRPRSSELDEEYALQARFNAPPWTKWKDQQIETSIGDVRQLGNQTVIAYSILNPSDQPIEIVIPQIQITGHKVKKKKKEGKGVISDQLEIRDYRLSTTRLGPGERADGAVVFDRPSFKVSTEKLFLQIAQADQVDHPILIRLPFTPPIAGYPR